MEHFLGRYAPYLYALMRIMIGVHYACHGAQKLFGLFGGVGGPPGGTVPLGSLLGVAGLIELGGGLLITVGWWAGSAAFLASGEMATAYFLQHAPRGFWPIQNSGERAVLYCFLFLYIASRGAGRWSLDRLRGNSLEGSGASNTQVREATSLGGEPPDVRPGHLGDG
jgi:putative oxidoreductase